MKIDHVKALLNEIMAVSTLLSGFSIGMAAKINDGAIRAYATWNKNEFFGKHSHFCTFDIPNSLPGAPTLSSLPSWDAEDPNRHSDTDSYCSVDGCWVGHWQTLDAAKRLNFTPCSLSASDVRASYPEYWEEAIEQKVASVHLELGRNTMTIIMTTVAVITLGSLLRLSLVKRFDTPEAWLARFYPLLLVLVVLPLFNFSNFLTLASRVIRILWYYCDDYVSTACMVSKTPGFERLERLLLGIGVVVWILHLSLPAAPPKSSSRAGAVGSSAGAGTSIDERLVQLVALRNAGDLTSDEFTAAKAALLSLSVVPSGAAASPSPASVRLKQQTALLTSMHE